MCVDIKYNLISSWDRQSVKKKSFIFIYLKNDTSIAS